jgi:hypothetical protein
MTYARAAGSNPVSMALGAIARSATGSFAEGGWLLVGSGGRRGQQNPAGTQSINFVRQD